jgi:hypothetical protein
MARFHVKGYVDLVVIKVEDEREMIDDTYEAESEEEARELAIEDAKDEYSDAIDVKDQYDRLTITVIEETADERAAREALATYRQMRAMHAPTLPGMEAR